MSTSAEATAPSRDEVERALVDLLRGRTSRVQVDAWVSERLDELDGEIPDAAVWTTLSLLSGVTLKISPDHYLHDDAQIAEWLEEFRQRRRFPGDEGNDLRAIRALTGELSYVIARERVRRMAPEALPARRRVDRKPPHTMCHILASRDGDALCGLDGGQLIEVAVVTRFDEVPAPLRCEDCASGLRAGVA